MLSKFVHLCGCAGAGRCASRCECVRVGVCKWVCVGVEL